MGCNPIRLATRAADVAKKLLLAEKIMATDAAKARFKMDQPPDITRLPKAQESTDSSVCLPFRDISDMLLSGGIHEDDSAADDREAVRIQGSSSSESCREVLEAGTSSDSMLVAVPSLNNHQPAHSYGPATNLDPLMAALEGWGVMDLQLRESLLKHSR